jgi:hypothetical protein
VLLQKTRSIVNQGKLPLCVKICSYNKLQFAGIVANFQKILHLPPRKEKQTVWI